jgi:Sec-independent protein translocase protein TatA
MDFFGVGWLEIFFILIIVLLVAGPKDIERGARGLGRMINRLNHSPTYMAVRRASNELRNLPARLAREANLEELKELSQEVKQVKEEVQQVRQEIKDNTSNLPGAGKSFQAWVSEAPAAEPPAPPPMPAAARTAANNGPAPAPAPDPTAPKDA